jgi:3',5'-cyclic-AMP phosphodiesterase
MKSFALMVTMLLQSVTVPATSMTTHEPPEISFPVISDIHVQSGDERSQQKFRAALQDLQDTNPKADALVINGDLGNGASSDYNTLRSIMEQAPHAEPVYYTIGNHEFYKAWFDKNGTFSPISFPNGETEKASINRYLSLTGEDHVYYDKWVKGYHMIFLGSEGYRQSDPNNQEKAVLSGDQLAWLKKELAEQAQPNKPIFVFLHQPVVSTVQGEQLREILTKYPQAILFSSHTHITLYNPNTIKREGYTTVNTSSVYQPSNEKDEPLPADASEGLMVSVFKDKVLISGRDFHEKKWISDVQYVVPLLTATDRPL